MCRHVCVSLQACVRLFHACIWMCRYVCVHTCLRVIMCVIGITIHVTDLCVCMCCRYYSTYVMDLRVCVCVCARVCVHACMRVCVVGITVYMWRTHVWVCVCMCARACMHACMRDRYYSIYVTDPCVSVTHPQAAEPWRFLSVPWTLPQQWCPASQTHCVQATPLCKTTTQTDAATCPGSKTQGHFYDISQM